MISKTIFIILAVIIHGIVHAQNLIPNAGFEQKTIIEGDSTCFTYSFPHWECLSNDPGCGVFKTYFFDFREYFKEYKIELHNYYTTWEYDHNCSVYRKNYPNSKANENYVCFYKQNDENKPSLAAVDTTNHFYKAWEGNCYIKSLYSFDKNLFQVKFKDRLKKDSTYYFEMYYRFPRYFENSFNSGQFGAYFTNTNFKDDDKDKFLNKDNYTPHILISELDTNALNNWVKFSCEFIAERDFEFMIIGNHKPFNDIGLSNPITYYIDCLTLVKKK